MQKIIISIISIIVIGSAAITSLPKLKTNDTLVSDQYLRDADTKFKLPVYKNSTLNGRDYQWEEINEAAILTSKINTVSHVSSSTAKTNSSNYESYNSSFTPDAKKKNLTSAPSGGTITALHYGKENKKNDNSVTTTGLVTISHNNMNLLLNNFGEKAEYANKITPPSNLVNTTTEQLPIGNEVFPLLLFALFFIIKRKRRA
ncbi:hypothetical protein LJB95_01780 [Paludibacteraceae bacterium OttesenSCG-928-F17]|nr:hypothetical protein [Paludibacteraceae bacterium OttesenSCG-928-F17]